MTNIDLNKTNDIDNRWFGQFSPNLPKSVKVIICFFLK